MGIIEAAQYHEKHGNDRLALGVIQHHLKQMDPSEAVQDPQLFALIDTRGHYYEKLRYWKCAMRDADTIIFLRPNDARGYLRKSRVYHKIGMQQEAQCTLKNALSKVTHKSKHWYMISREWDQLKVQSKCVDPLSCLPRELLFMIFQKVIKTSSDLAVVSLVSKGWRDHIYSEASYWSTLHFVDRKRYITHKAIDRCVSRSKGRPLKLRISCGIQRPERFLNSLARYQSLHSLWLEKPSLTLDSMMAKQLIFRHLVHLRISTTSLGSTLVWVLESMPQLKTLALTQLSTRAGSKPLYQTSRGLGQLQLESLVAKSYAFQGTLNPSILQSIVSQCPQLRYLRLVNVVESIDFLEPMLKAKRLKCDFTPSKTRRDRANIY